MRDAIEGALDQDTVRLMDEQRAWIAREPGNSKPYYHLGQFCRMTRKADEALALFLHAVSLDAEFADAHLALTEMYVVKADYTAAWRHARKAHASGDSRGVELLARYRITEK